MASWKSRTYTTNAIHGEIYISESFCVVTTTIDDVKIARALAESVIEAHLSACVQIIPGVTSYFQWQDKIEMSQELLLQFKTTEQCAEKLMQYIKKSHSYDTPEIIMTKIDGVDLNYQKWVETAVNQDLS